MANVAPHPELLALLQQVKDPEIPTLSLVELGVIEQAELRPDGSVYVELIPTFAGCPAIAFMALEVEQVLKNAGYTQPMVVINKHKGWDSNKITEAGRQHLLDFGLAPPPRHQGDYAVEAVVCPHCGSSRTVLKNPFGPTLCRAIHYCQDCRETFEQFKPL